MRDADERVVAGAPTLRRAGDQLPMTRLQLDGHEVRREDRWPVPADYGAAVILAGGEVGRLLSWWNAADGSEWRWRLELYNHR